MKTDRQVHRNAIRILTVLAWKGLIPMYGKLQVSRTSHGFWLAYLEPKPVPGDEWKHR